jgi:hypothetical protein
MRTLAAIAAISGLSCWILWELRPSGSYFWYSDAPLIVLASQTAFVVCLVAGLMLVTAAIEAGSRPAVTAIAQSWLALAQIVVAACAAATGLYGIRQILFLREQVAGWHPSPELSMAKTPVIALALSPVMILMAAMALIVAARHIRGAATILILSFDAAALAFLGFLFANLYHWTCLSCSGPAL